MKDLVFFGIQGAGKGTQASLLVQAMPDAFSYFAMGDVFRTLTKTDNAIGNYLKKRMASGELIQDTVVNTLFQAYVYTVMDDKKYMLLDGYPRTIPQMETTLTFLEEYNRDVVGIQFVIPDDFALERMRGRARADDTQEAMAYRIQQFYDSTQPTIDYFAEHAPLHKIDATRTIDEIHQDVVTLLS